MSESINAEFEAYVKAELGDIAVVSEGRFISPKIQNYYKIWNNQQTKITELESQVEALKQTDTVELYGMKDGIQIHLGRAPMPPRMKAKEIVVSVFGHFDEHDDMDDGDAALCFSCMTELIDYMIKQERTQITQLQAEVEALRGRLNDAK